MLRTLKSVKKVTPFPLYDITVDERHCFLLENGIVAHNSMDMYPKAVVSGGCVEAGTEIIAADGSLVRIEDVRPGDRVRTLTGDAEVIHTWTPDTLEEGEPECVEVAFEEGARYVVSVDHAFLTSQGDKFVWVRAEDLTPEMDVVGIS